jgi:UDP-2,3-diacylglucosamine hydrolase
MTIQVGENSTYYNIGDWIAHYTYGVYDENGFKLEEFLKK